MQTLKSLVVGLGSILIAACSNDAIKDLNDKSLTPEQVKSQMQVNSITDGLDRLVTELLINDKTEKSSKTNTECATLAFTENSITVAYDQCNIEGNNVSGTMVLTGNNGSTDGSKGNFAISFTDFTYNDYLINGTKTLSFDFSDPNSPTFTIVTDATLEDANGDIAIWKGNKVLSWHLDQINAEEADVECTGDWDISLDGITYQFTVTAPLSANLGCSYITSGVIQLEVEGKTAFLDFGSGSCDQTAAVTFPNGKSEEISW